MFNPIRLACNLLDSFGLPRAAGNLHSDRFIVANESFLRIVGLEKDEISRVALSDVVKIHFGSTDTVKIGRLIPITVCTADEAVTLTDMQKPAYGQRHAFNGHCSARLGSGSVGAVSLDPYRNQPTVSRSRPTWKFGFFEVNHDLA